MYLRYSLDICTLNMATLAFASSNLSLRLRYSSLVLSVPAIRVSMRATRRSTGPIPN
jgi:hypothetical protein